MLGGTNLQNVVLSEAQTKRRRGESLAESKKEDREGRNLYRGGFQELSVDAVQRARNLKKERQISPVNFNSMHKTSTRQDDKVSASSLNQYNSRQVAAMLLKKAARKRQIGNQTMDFMFMHEPETIDVIREQNRRGTFQRKKSVDKIFEQEQSRVMSS